MDYVLLSETINRDYYMNKKEDAYKLIEMLKHRYNRDSKAKIIVLYLGTNYDNRIKRDYRLSVEITRK